jgi:hypothetical protein
MQRILLSITGAFAMAVGSLASTGTAFALHEDGHWIGIAAWEIDGAPVAMRDQRLNEDGAETPLPRVQQGGRVSYLIRVVDQTDDVEIGLAFNSPGHAYVLGSASGGSCATPAEAAPGIFNQTCTVSVGDSGSGDLYVTYEITAASNDACDGSSGEQDTVTLVVSEPVRNASDVVVCAGSATAPTGSPVSTSSPAPALPDTALTDSSEADRPNAAIALLATLLVLCSFTLLLRRR